MGEHTGRRRNTPPGPGRRTTAGIAAVPTASTTGVAESTDAPAAVTAQDLIALVNEVCDLWARAEVARAMAGHSTTEAEHTHLAARADHWAELARERYETVAGTITAVLPDAAAQIERFMPVRPLDNGHVELRVHDADARLLVVLLSGSQALALGTHLTAHGAISLDRAGHKIDNELPHIAAVPPLTATPTTGHPADAISPPAHP
ncbi:hypothetical protein Val02_66500 [Virgisporangium aliadipatigenens]|uniref:Uncharacterized protein n=1 Tax=Virgisporangium aliadipatigenens TaxID=741659 RepID=A0A8J4DTH2_9ACTN|nr:hypothetical protein [Virgisporangium aliadipatigenens]GIJ49764.1 hypothetical protein Val02_66500 [Virgisporangium aliadipatigenens]